MQKLAIASILLGLFVGKKAIWVRMAYTYLVGSVCQIQHEVRRLRKGLSVQRQMLTTKGGRRMELFVKWRETEKSGGHRNLFAF